MTLFCAVFFASQLPLVIRVGGLFNPLGSLPVLLPLIWGFYALFTYRGRAEWIIGWIAFLIGIVCFWIAFQGNLVWGIADFLNNQAT